MKRYFITGIDTNVGKTLASAVLAEALQADYWKPIQTGTTEGNDTKKVIDLISNKKTIIHNEDYTFAAPVSPHLAAAIENKVIELEKINLPETENNLIIEGAGGILVPLNRSNYMINLTKKFDAEVILVVRNYVGCINHTLLSIDYLIKHNYKVKGLILNGSFDALVEDAIMNYSAIPLLAKFPDLNKLDKETILDLVKLIKKEMLL